jgi:hypothetical protein
MKKYSELRLANCAWLSDSIRSGSSRNRFKRIEPEGIALNARDIVAPNANGALSFPTAVDVAWS